MRRKMKFRGAITVKLNSAPPVPSGSSGFYIFLVAVPATLSTFP